MRTSYEDFRMVIAGTARDAFAEIGSPSPSSTACWSSGNWIRAARRARSA